MKHVEGGHFRVHPEFLRQVAEQAPSGILLRDQVEAVKTCRTGIRIEQRGEDLHQGGFARTVGPDESKHPRRYVQRNTAKGANASGISFRQVVNGKHWSNSLPDGAIQLVLRTGKRQSFKTIP